MLPRPRALSMFAFFKRPASRQLVVAAAAPAPARPLLQGLLDELPDLLLACVVEVASGQLLASYARHARYNPHHLSLRYARLLRTRPPGAPADGSPLEMTTVLDHELHHLRQLTGGHWYCFVAARTADTNLAVLRELVRRHAA